MLYDSFVRQDIQQKQALLKAKRQFVRFISHEVRTPLNAVSMGLQFLQDEIARFIGSQFSKHNEQSGEPMKLEDKLTEWSDLSEDILHSTKSAVDVLNDLLNYDKIESGNLRLELTVVPIWSLIDHTASEFQLQAKKKSINYHIDFGELVDPGNTDSETGGDSKWTEEAKELQVIGDEVRITQVLRNLISNALKFTPVGGKFSGAPSGVL
jgi:signal transduction histidine kinase